MLTREHWHWELQRCLLTISRMPRPYIYRIMRSRASLGKASWDPTHWQLGRRQDAGFRSRSSWRCSISAELRFVTQARTNLELEHAAHQCQCLRVSFSLASGPGFQKFRTARWVLSEAPGASIQLLGGSIRKLPCDSHGPRLWPSNIPDLTFRT